MLVGVNMLENTNGQVVQAGIVAYAGDSSKRRLLRYDVLRLLATFMVISAHFDTHLPEYLRVENYIMPFRNGLGSYLLDGSLAVAIFFMLSGYFSYNGLMRSDYRPFRYLRKRFSRLLIPMWIAWLIGFALWLFHGRLLQAQGWTFILTVLGLDGYYETYVGMPSYALVGEWYTSALLCVTLCMPMLRPLIKNKFWWAFGLVVLIELAFGMNIDVGRSQVLYWRSPMVSVASFVIGMALARVLNDEKRKIRLKWRMLIGMILIANSVFVHRMSSPIAPTIAFQLCGVGYFLVFDSLGDLLSRKRGGLRIIAIVAARLSDLSYYMYLFQHIVIFIVLEAAARALSGGVIYTFPVILLLVLVIAMTIALALAASWIERSLRNIMTF